MSNINDKLFLRVLQIGRDNISGGLRFCDLKTQLKSEGYDINSCIDRTLREWFYTSFFHEEAHCDAGKPNSYSNVSNLDEHQCCSFILKGDSCIKLLQYEESKKSNKILLGAIIALFLTVIVGLPDWWNLINHSSTTDLNTSIQQVEKSTNQELLKLQQSTQHVLGFLDNNTSSDSTNLATNEKILKSLQNINYQLIKLNRQNENE